MSYTQYFPDTDNPVSVMKQAGRDSGDVGNVAGKGRKPGDGQTSGPVASASPLQTVAAGILGGVSPMQFTESIHAGNCRLGNRAFMQWVETLVAGTPAGAAAAQGVCGPVRSVAAAPLTERGPVQMMGKKKKKPVAGPEEKKPGVGRVEAGPEEKKPGVGRVEAGPEREKKPGAGPVEAGPKEEEKPESGASLPGLVEALSLAAPPETDAPVKKKKKSRVQVALIKLRGEGPAAFGGYIESEIGEAELLHTLVGRINRAEDLRGVRAEALAMVEGRLRLLDPGAVASAQVHSITGGQEPEIAAVAPVKTGLGFREAELLDVCKKGDAARFRRLLKHGNVDVNIGSENGTMLCMAAINGHWKIVAELLSVPGIDVNLAHPTGATPLNLAVMNGNVEVVRLLLDARGIKINLQTSEGATPLIMAAQLGYEEMVKLLLDAPGIEIDTIKPDVPTATYMAASTNFPGIVELLIRRGADVNLAFSGKGTPLCYAAENGYLKVVRILLQAPGVIIDRAPDSAYIPLVKATAYGHKDIVEELLRHGADPNKKHKASGATALHYACQDGHLEIVKILIRAGADTDAKLKIGDEERFTPGEIAEVSGHLAVVSELAAQGGSAASP